MPSELLLTWPGTFPGARYAVMGLVIMVGACVQGVGGIGFALFSAPIAGLFFPELAPGPLLVLGGSVSVLAAAREFASIDWKVAGFALSGRVLGAVLAVGLLTLLSVTQISIAFALMILAAVALSVAGWKVEASRGNSFVAGTVSGVMGTITSAGAPPLAIVMQHMPPERLRSTVACIFVAGASISLVLLAAVGRFDAAQFALSLLLLPWLVAGFLASGRVGRRISPGGVRRMLLALCTLGALGILAKAALTSS